jgi:hypothetical protein
MTMCAFSARVVGMKNTCSLLPTSIEQSADLAICREPYEDSPKHFSRGLLITHWNKLQNKMHIPIHCQSALLGERDEQQVSRNLLYAAFHSFLCKCILRFSCSFCLQAHSIDSLRENTWPTFLFISEWTYKYPDGIEVWFWMHFLTM